MVTLLHDRLGLDRARRVVSSHVASPTMGGNWRVDAVAPAFGATTGLFTDACTANVNGTAVTEVNSEQAIKRPARHLGTRST